VIMRGFSGKLLLLAALPAILAVCAPPVQNGEDGNVRIVLPGGAGARSYVSPEIQDKLAYTMEFYGPGGARRQAGISPGAGSVTIFLALGVWTVHAEAYLQDLNMPKAELFGRGEAHFTVRGGRTNAVEISMHTIADLEDFGPNPVVTQRFDVNDLNTWSTACNDIKEPGNYVINLTGGFDLDGADYSTFGYGENIKVSLRGAHTIQTGILGSLLSVKANQTLILRDLTLQGRSGNNAPLVYVYGGSLVMNAGARVMGNINTSGSGGGVFVRDDGTFTMEGGEISGNSAADSGGGVCAPGGNFIMKGGEISGISAADSGGGVFASGSNFTMEGGEISGNTASTSGGGVFASGSIFIMKGGEIFGNTASTSGGGVYVNSSFSKTGDSIIYGDTSNNNANVVKDSTLNLVDTWGHAVFYEKDSGNEYYRDTTLGKNADISTDNVPDTVKTEYDGTNWIKK
jgi:hypothetical protein